MIHVCYCFRDKTGRYAKFAGTSMLSLFENTHSKVTVHILHDDTLTDENRDKFSYIAGNYDQIVKFYNLSELCPDKIAEIIKLIPEIEKSRVTIGALYKLLIPKLLPKDIHKVVFLEPDTLVNLDITELWQIELGDKVMGVVPEKENGTNCDKAFLLCSEGKVEPEDYFNSGVLLMNLDILQNEEKAIMQGIKFRGYNPNQNFLDQTILNYCFSACTVKLPLKFNIFARTERRNPDYTLGEKIYHFVGRASKIGIEMNDPLNRLWMNYFIKTPFFDTEAMGHLYTPLHKIRNELKDSALKISKILLTRTRAFFIEPKKLDDMVNFFLIKSQEKVILAENEDSIQNLINDMQTSKGKCVFFIMTENFLRKKFPFDQLNKAGFVEGEDYIKGWQFLTNAPFNSHTLIEEM